MRAAGFSRPLLAHHVRRGRYQRVQPGLHRLAQFPHSLYEDLVIAQLGAGPQAVISHDSALAVYLLSDVTPAEIHITAPRSTSRRRRGIRLHTQKLAENEITFHEGLRLTTVERTIADMAACGLADEQIALAIREAIARGLTTRRRLAEQASRRRGRARRVIDRELESRVCERVTRSSYDRETDSLYIELAPRASADSREVADGIVLDFDADGRLVGIGLHPIFRTPR